MIAIGFDPGTRHLGWGVVRRDGNRMKHLAHGVLDLDGKLALGDRLVLIERGIEELLTRHEPDVGSVESIFFHKDAQAAVKLGHARGVIMLCLARSGLPYGEYPPARIKRTVTGNGQAPKAQVARMICTLLALDETPPSDAADALAIAITHLRVGGLVARLQQGGSSQDRVRALLRQSSGRRGRRGAQR